MHFFRDGFVNSVLEYPKKRGRLSSSITYTFLFSALASCVALPPASMQVVRAVFPHPHKKITIFKSILY
jgi:hypothetical protein